MSDFLTRASRLASTFSEQLDNRLKDRIVDAGWSQEMSIYSKGARIELSYEMAEETNIFESEYGSENMSPNAVIRPVLRSVNKELEVAITQDALEYLFSEGILP